MKADLGLRSTPVEEHELAGLRFRVWREDLVGGNKYRGLEHLLGKPAKRLLTISTLSANQALATARAGRKLCLDTDAIIVRWGKAGPVLEALRNEANVIEVNGVVGAVFAALRRWRPGTRVIPPGGASVLGARGYRDAVLALDEVPTRIWLPVGTGNTASGILAGLLQRDAACEVVGVRVIRGTTARAIWRRAHKVSGRRDRGNVTLRLEEARGAYGEVTQDATAAVEAAARIGLTLDTTYSGKALAHLLRERPADATFLLTYADP